jgi:DNA-binding MarR family transcriptional regulator
MKRASRLDQGAIADGLDRLVLWARRSMQSEMSSTSITTLDTLEYAGPLRITDLARREGVSQPGMTTVVNRLENEGLAQRIADPTDGRVALVRVTSAGRQVLRERRTARSMALRTVIAKLPDGHQAALGNALDALLALAQTAPEQEWNTP